MRSGSPDGGWELGKGFVYNLTHTEGQLNNLGVTFHNVFGITTDGMGNVYFGSKREVTKVSEVATDVDYNYGRTKSLKLIASKFLDRFLEVQYEFPALKTELNLPISDFTSNYTTMMSGGDDFDLIKRVYIKRNFAYLVNINSPELEAANESLEKDNRFVKFNDLAIYNYCYNVHFQIKTITYAINKATLSVNKYSVQGRTVGQGQYSRIMNNGLVR